MARPTIEQVRSMVERLHEYGQGCYKKEARPVDRGTAIGKAIAAVSGPEVVVPAAIEMLEDWNGHLSVAAIAAIEQGQGKVVRKGRKLTITLPKGWENW